MRVWPALFALAGCVCGCGASGPAVPRAGPAPVRVMSTNLCADQLVLALLPPKRIASVTWLARDPSGSLMASAARRVGVNHGQAEEVLAQRPDLVIAGTYTTPALRGMLRRLDYPLLEVEDPTDVDGIRRVTRQVAAAVGRRARGEALIAAMDTQLAALTRDPAPSIRVAAWDRSGFSAGEGSLYATMLAAAGARNVALDGVAKRFRKPDVEVLLAANPALLVQGSIDPGAASLGDAVTRHRVVRRRWRGKTVFIPQAGYACGTPMMAEAALRLRGELRSKR